MTEIAQRVIASVPWQRALVAVDGTDGSGKTRFASELAAAITKRPVLVLHVDDFLNPSAVRHARGRCSPEGFWLDSYNYAALRSWALDPLSAVGDGRYRAASFDAATDTVIRPAAKLADEGTLVLVEGLFLHRDELVGYWDTSLFLDVPFSETARRMATRDGSHPDPNDASMRRYVEGQRIYFRSASPWERAGMVIDNSVCGQPRMISADQATASTER
ncbi:uridine kinase [Curtobacterium ammoniigenes]|uniref:uridine kinase n=1 Tax=Curtobacterium ammoniigenes TaxID=395387 RepID=UPI0008300B44|nr:uridine kinase [Curtobacterium ammoniigenes]